MPEINVGSRILESAAEALAISEGRLEASSFRTHVPETVEVRRIRKQARMTQAQFAAAFGLNVSTLRNWEQGKRRPDPAARAYLSVIAADPAHVLRVLARDAAKGAA